MNITDKVIKRFWELVDRRPNNECWEWAGSLRKASCRWYGQFRIDRKLRASHRVAWEIAYGAIPRYFQVLHNCDDTTCVNPAHLSIGTNRDNVDDRMKKRRELEYIQRWW